MMPLALADYLMTMLVILTAIMAGSVVWQAMSTRKMAKLYRDQHEHEVEKTNPKVHIGLRAASFSTGPYRPQNFFGFSITNASQVEVTITYIELELGLFENHRGEYIPYLNVPPTKEYNGKVVSDFEPPHRLKYGEAIKILYDEDVLAKKQESMINGQRSPRFRFRCSDSLGNYYNHHSWMEFGSDGQRSYPDPGDGIIAVSEWNERRLRKARR